MPERFYAFLIISTHMFKGFLSFTGYNLEWNKIKNFIIAFNLPK